MYCPATTCLFLRADGSVACWDDAGCATSLQAADQGGDLSAVYTHEGGCGRIFEALSHGRMPFPEICPRCLCLSFTAKPAFDCELLDLLQIEPSNDCSLACPCCEVTGRRLAGTLRPALLDHDLLRRFLSDFLHRGVTIRRIDFQGHGEPLTHPGLWKLVRLAKDFFPEACTSICTNAQGDVPPEAFDSGIDQIDCAIDGVDQESLSRYRIGGDFARAFGFMKRMAGGPFPGTRPRVVWRYLLFEHNDGQEQLRKAWDIASGAGVGELRFIFTDTGPFSRRIGSPGDLARALDSAGLPGGRIRLGTRRSRECREDLRQMLYRSRLLTRLAGRCWRARPERMAASRSGSLPAVTCDFHASEAGNLRKALVLGADLVRSGRKGDAALILSHVDFMLARPVIQGGARRRRSAAEAFGRLHDDLAKSVRSRT